MPQPTFNASAVTFGGLAQPNGQGTFAAVNLNDGANWSLQDFKPDAFVKQMTKSQQVWLSKGLVSSRDFPGFGITLPMLYSEIPGTKIGAALASLALAGEQQLSFDGATYLLAEFEQTKSRTWRRRYPPFLWDVELAFWCRNPFYLDLSGSSLASTPIVYAPTAAPSGSAAAGGALTAGTYTLEYTYVTASGETAPSPASSSIVLSGGNLQISVSAVTPLPSFATAVKWYFATGPTTGFTVQNSGAAFTLNTAGSGTAPPATTPATAFSQTYAGSVWAEPVWTLSIPGSNTGVITSAVLANTMSGQALIALFPGGLRTSTAYTITIDCGVMTVTDQNGTVYDVGGSFPFLFQPAGQSNPFTVALVTSSGVASGATIAASWSNRWLN